MIDKRIGILGGGQLGKMLCLAGAKMSMDISILDSSKDYPAGSVCNSFYEGDISNYDEVLSFGNEMDIITIEFEKINVAALEVLESLGKLVFPSAKIISTIQDKGVQKQFYCDNEIPTSKFVVIQNKEELFSLLESGTIEFPFVQKTRKDGYDGYGVKICKSEDAEFFDAPSIIEELVDIKKEVAIIICRSKSGEIAIYEPVEMIFNSEANLLDYQISPALIEMDTTIAINDLAYKIATCLDLVGLLAIELFITSSGEILVNEMAPRPHNSGHHTIEACQTSQYENHLRAICDLPLGLPKNISPSVLINLLGSPSQLGDVKYSGIDDILKIPGSNLHIYGKKKTKPFRKMGHVNILFDKDSDPIKYINQVKHSFKTTLNK